MPPQIAKTKATAKSKTQTKQATTDSFAPEANCPSKVGAKIVRNPKGLKLKPIKKAKLPYICTRGSLRTRNQISPSASATPVNPHKASPRDAPDGMNGFINYYELLHIHRNASHMTVSQAWEKYAIKQVDPLIAHKDFVKGLNDFILWHDVYQWLLVDEYTRSHYNWKLERFERMSAAELRGGYSEVYFAYNSEDDDRGPEELDRVDSI